MEDDRSEPAIEMRLAAIERSLERIDGLLDKYLPMLDAYLDPEQPGPRGYFMRKRLAATNGRADHG